MLLLALRTLIQPFLSLSVALARVLRQYELGTHSGRFIAFSAFLGLLWWLSPPGLWWQVGGLWMAYMTTYASFIWFPLIPIWVSCMAGLLAHAFWDSTHTSLYHALMTAQLLLPLPLFPKICCFVLGNGWPLLAYFRGHRGKDVVSICVYYTLVTFVLPLTAWLGCITLVSLLPVLQALSMLNLMRVFLTTLFITHTIHRCFAQPFWRRVKAGFAPKRLIVNILANVCFVGLVMGVCSFTQSLPGALFFYALPVLYQQMLFDVILLTLLQGFYFSDDLHTQYPMVQLLWQGILPAWAASMLVGACFIDQRVLRPCFSRVFTPPKQSRLDKKDSDALALSMHDAWQGLLGEAVVPSMQSV